MPKRTDIKKILIIGSGPITIGQACEFDYSGTQACKALKQEGFEVVLINSNPATIMTDPELADRTYIEPLTVDSVTAVIERERPQALLPTVGGQTALNLAVALSESGVLDTYKVELIGAKLAAIKVAEDRRLFKQAMDEIELKMPRAAFANTLEQAIIAVEEIGYPAIIRPSFTLGGSGGGTAYNSEEFIEIVTTGLNLSPIHEILIEESIIGWKEYELEVMRDLADNVVIICSIENFDPMGIHTGDSITVAPAQTLTDREYQQMRDAAIKVIRKVGVETGGSNIQFAVNPYNGQLRIIEMNPRVSRSSALASKATGFPIAKIAAKLAIGYTLDEISNDITKRTPASFEPMIDYVVVKIPKWAFEKFPAANPTLGTQMKSVGEVMAIGASFKEALLKGMRSLETGKSFGGNSTVTDDELRCYISTPNAYRLTYLCEAFARGWTVDMLYQLASIDRWFLGQLHQIAELQKQIKQEKLTTLSPKLLFAAKRTGLSDQHLASLLNCSEIELRTQREEMGILPVYKRVDTCAAEFESHTPYLYSSYAEECEAEPTNRNKIIILGSGPNRIGQGIEFDYCCCHASFALKEAGYETIMVNCNPETVSTDYDTADRLYFEPITFEDVMNIVEIEKPMGMIVQFGGQTPLNLALKLLCAGVPIIGTSPESIDLAEDRKRFGCLLKELDIAQPNNGTAISLAEARRVVAEIGYPILIRPSYVLGGRAMAIVYDDIGLERYISQAVEVSSDCPILIDSFLEGAVEVDVDALSDGEHTVITGIQEHIEEAGIHSGDSSSVLPTFTIAQEQIEIMRNYTRKLAAALRIVGLVNIQFAVKAGRVYVLEANPRASRTVPFVSKATGVPIAKIAALLMVGHKLAEFNLPDELSVKQFCIKTPVFPFVKFPGIDPILGPEMRSTGEVMGIGDTFSVAYLKAQYSAGNHLPCEGTVLISVSERDQEALVGIAHRLNQLGFKLIITGSLYSRLVQVGLPVELAKVKEIPHEMVKQIKSKKITLIINTPRNCLSCYDAWTIRNTATQYNIPCITTITGAQAIVSAIESLQQVELSVCSLQEYYR
ncbi:MAG: carbamoyl-phosphate synthase large subunit [Acidobacteriota bacterium]